MKFTSTLIKASGEFSFNDYSSPMVVRDKMKIFWVFVSMCLCGVKNDASLNKDGALLEMFLQLDEELQKEICRKMRTNFITTPSTRDETMEKQREICDQLRLNNENGTTEAKDKDGITEARPFVWLNATQVSAQPAEEPCDGMVCRERNHTKGIHVWLNLTQMPEDVDADRKPVTRPFVWCNATRGTAQTEEEPCDGMVCRERNHTRGIHVWLNLTQMPSHAITPKMFKSIGDDTDKESAQPEEEPCDAMVCRERNHTRHIHVWLNLTQMPSHSTTPKIFMSTGDEDTDKESAQPEEEPCDAMVCRERNHTKHIHVWLNLTQMPSHSITPKIFMSNGDEDTNKESAPPEEDSCDGMVCRERNHATKTSTESSKRVARPSGCDEIAVENDEHQTHSDSGDIRYMKDNGPQTPSEDGTEATMRGDSENAGLQTITTIAADKLARTWKKCTLPESFQVPSAAEKVKNDGGDTRYMKDDGAQTPSEDGTEATMRQNSKDESAGLQAITTIAASELARTWKKCTLPESFQVPSAAEKVKNDGGDTRYTKDGGAQTPSEDGTEATMRRNSKDESAGLQAITTIAASKLARTWKKCTLPDSFQVPSAAEKVKNDGGDTRYMKDDGAQTPSEDGTEATMRENSKDESIGLQAITTIAPDKLAFTCRTCTLPKSFEVPSAAEKLKNDFKSTTCRKLGTPKSNKFPTTAANLDITNYQSTSCQKCSTINNLPSTVDDLNTGSRSTGCAVCSTIESNDNPNYFKDTENNSEFPTTMNDLNTDFQSTNCRRCSTKESNEGETITDPQLCNDETCATTESDTFPSSAQDHNDIKSMKSDENPPCNCKTTKMDIFPNNEQDGQNDIKEMKYDNKSSATQTDSTSIPDQNKPRVPSNGCEPSENNNCIFQPNDTSILDQYRKRIPTGECDAVPGNIKKLTLDVENPKKSRRRTRVRSPIGNLCSFAGFFNTNDKQDVRLFFWLFRSKKNWQNAPVIVWLQGEPGWSSLYGLFEEHGPYYIQQTVEGLNISLRQFSWIEEYNVLYLDNCVGCGFSIAQDKRAQIPTYKNVGKNVYQALSQFFIIFSELTHNDLYLAGSYGGAKYIPVIAHMIHTQNSHKKVVMNLKGMFIGGPYIDAISMVSYGDYLYENGLIDVKKKQRLESNQRFAEALIRASKYQSAVRFLKRRVYCEIARVGYKKLYDIRYLKPTNGKYMFETYVPEIIETKTFKKMICTNNLKFKNSSEILIKEIMCPLDDLIPELLEHYKILYYNGQFDIMSPYTTTSEYLLKMNWKSADGFYASRTKNWCATNRSQPDGYYKHYKNLTHVMIRNAGHTVGTTNPESLFHLLKWFVEGKFQNNRTCGKPGENIEID